MELWEGLPDEKKRGQPLKLKRSGEWVTVASGVPFVLTSGERVTLVPGVYHRFWPEEADTIIGEVSTANDDVNDNIFADARVARFTAIIEDEPPAVRLVSDRA
jgi:D-lyxose ketol-isomerase